MAGASRARSTSRFCAARRERVLPLSARPSSEPPRTASRWAVAIAAGLVLATVAAYRNSLGGPFVFDDVGSIPQNPTLARWWSAWSPPHGGQTVSGRPLLNFSFALNYAAGGTAVAGYHALNVAIHALAGLAWFGVVRRTLLQPALRERFGVSALPLALAAAAVWLLHPLQTEAVTYVVQRAESLMGLCYLLTLYCFIRGTGEGASGWWRVAAFAACLAGMATKEVMVSAPAIVLLYDRTFVAGSWRGTWRERARFHLALGSTWLLLAALVAATGGTRDGSSGGLLAGGWRAHGLTQFDALATYLKLAVWPRPLVFEYEPEWVQGVADVARAALLGVALIALTVAGLKYRPAVGFFGAWFFAVLAPTLAVPTTSQLIVEHRMYLALAPAVGLAAMGLHAALGRRAAMALLVLAVGLGGLTIRRNDDYRTGAALWGDTVAKRPRNPVAHFNLADFLRAEGRVPEAIAHYEEALRLAPSYAEAHNNLGLTLLAGGDVAGAIGHFELAVKFRASDAEAHYNLGMALARTRREAEAVPHFEAALRLRPDYAEAHNNLGNTLLQMRRLPEAVEQYEAALRLRDELPEAHYNLGNVLAQLGRWPDAVAHFERALRFTPQDADTHFALANALSRLGDTAGAVRHYEETLRLDPGNAAAREGLRRLAPGR